MKKRKSDLCPAPDYQEPVPSLEEEEKAAAVPSPVKNAAAGEGGSEPQMDRKTAPDEPPKTGAEESQKNASREPRKAGPEAPKTGSRKSGEAAHSAPENDPSEDAGKGSEQPSESDLNSAKKAEEKQPASDEKTEPVPGKKSRAKVLVGRLMTLLGLLFLIAALMLWLYNRQEAQEAAEVSQNMLPSVRDAIVEKVEQSETQPVTAPTHVNPYDDMAVEQSKEMTVWTNNGWSYIGYLTIPKLELELPILSELSQYNLGMAPCRHLGSTKSDDLVLAAHNYDFHFGRIRQLAPGDEVSFVDMDGILSLYQVVTVNVIEPTDIDLVTDPSLDLTLYTCTYGGQNRIMVGCQRVQPEE